MKILTLNECGLVAGGLMPRAGAMSVRGEISSKRGSHPDLLPPGGGGGGGGGYGGYGYGFFAGYGGYDGTKPIAAWESRAGYVTFQYASGATSDPQQELGEGGADHPIRDNNPVDVQCGSFAYSQGAIGCDRGGGNPTAIFTNDQQGFDASTLLMNDYNKDDFGGFATISDIVEKYSPLAGGNLVWNTEQDITNETGIPVTTLWSSLSPTQLNSVMTAYAHSEGYNGPSDRVSLSPNDVSAGGLV